MTLPRWSIRFLWLIPAAVAVAFLAMINGPRLERLARVTALADANVSPPAADPRSLTGYPSGQRELILPERNDSSLQTIMQTQAMLAEGTWRVRHVAYDNAPAGREVNATSPYRWWLGAIAWCAQAIGAENRGASVSTAAVYANLALQGLLIVFATAFVAWRCGAAAATGAAFGLIALYPFAFAFYPGLPDPHALSLPLIFFSLALLYAGILPRPNEPSSATRWFAAAGVVGGLALWVDAGTGFPILIGIFAAGLLLAISRWTRDDASGVGLPWRRWALAGGATTLIAYLIEYFPGHLAPARLEWIHPVYGVAWVGGGELLRRVGLWRERGKLRLQLADAIAMAVALLAIAGVPLAMHWTGSSGFLARDLSQTHASVAPGSTVASSLRAWVGREGWWSLAGATLLPLIVLVLVAREVFRRSKPRSHRVALLLALGPAVVAVAFALQRLAWWSTVDVCVLAAAVVWMPGVATSKPGRTAWLRAAGFAVLALPGLWAQLDSVAKMRLAVLTASEAESWAERDVAQWLSRRTSGQALVLAPPQTTTALCFYGGLRGLGTLSPDNEAGLTAAIRIITATSDDEALALIEGRGVTHLVIPTWDSFFEDYVRAHFARQGAAFISAIDEDRLPRWLRPIPFQTGNIGGFEDQSIRVFAVDEDQTEAEALSRLAEYWVEMGNLDKAAQAERRLRRFPADVGALVARAQVQSARGESDGLAETLKTILARVPTPAARNLRWERRVSLAVVLARAKRADLAREQLQRCADSVDESSARSLTTAELYNFLGLTGAYAIDMPAPLRRQMLDLLPPTLRERLERPR